jgi:Ni,Fe-hydrogenase III small subunit/Pyruvate/2-oxoacid:ferredoxin oxidoreductase delta subunit
MLHQQEETSAGIYHIDTGGCNGCAIEVKVLPILPYNKSFPCRFVEDPKKAKILLVTGAINQRMLSELKEVYGQLQKPNCVVIVGSCAISTGIYEGSPSVVGIFNEIFNRGDIYIAGCPPRPQAIIKGILMSLDKLGFKEVQFELTPSKEGFRGKPEFLIEKCNGCGACATVCPSKAITITRLGDKEMVEIFYGKCIFCAICEEKCPQDAIHLTENLELVLYTTREATANVKLDMVRCKICGRPMASSSQLKGIVRKLEEGGFTGESLDKFNDYLRICRRCRIAKMHRLPLYGE